MKVKPNDLQLDLRLGPKDLGLGSDLTEVTCVHHCCAFMVGLGCKTNCEECVLLSNYANQSSVNCVVAVLLNLLWYISPFVG